MKYNRKYFFTILLFLIALLDLRSEVIKYEYRNNKQNLINGLQGDIPTTLQLPHVFGNGMVLQQNTEVAVWGWAKPDASITVVGSWGNSVNTTTNSDGKWLVKIATPKAISGQAPKYTLTIGDGLKSIVYSNVLVGEVWLLSGQSNMQIRHQPQAPNYQSDVDSSKYYPNIRFCFSDPDTSSVPKFDSKATASWQQCSPPFMTYFSAVGYFFGKELYDHPALNIPIGLIQTAIGSTSIQSWIRKEVFDTDSLLKNYYLSNDSVSRKIYANNPYQIPSICYNGAISPIIPYTIKGALWYQGETNVGSFSNLEYYKKALISLIQDWRKLMSNDFSFYSAEIAPYNYTSSQKKDLGGQAALFREAQIIITQLPKTGMVVTSDILLDSTEVYNIHPYNKKPIGHRFALLALAKDYGQNVQYLGPIYSSHTIDGSYVRISFMPESLGSGLTTNNGMSPKCFKLAGTDRKFYPALATIQGNEIILSTPNVPNPVTARYAFSNFPMTNLMNNEGIAANPFRTDTWSWGSYIDLPEISVPTAITINKNEINVPTIFYNPSTKKLTLSASEYSISRIEIMDSMGRILFNRNNACSIDLESLNNGIYFVKIYDIQRKISVRKFVKN